MRSKRGLASDRSRNAALWLAIGGLVLIVIAGTFKLDIAKVSVDQQIANIGALIMVVGILQWLFDTQVRNSFFSEIRSELIENRQVVDSGISGYVSDSKEVLFGNDFFDSERVIIGTNYSTKLVDASLGALEKRVKLGKSTDIIVVKDSSPAWEFMKADFNNTEMSASINKIKSVARDLNESKQLVSVIEVDTLLRYAFVLFDSRIWVIIGTNGSGRRAVPGFFVRSGSPWFEHFVDDIEKLRQRTPIASTPKRNPRGAKGAIRRILSRFSLA